MTCLAQSRAAGLFLWSKVPKPDPRAYVFVTVIVASLTSIGSSLVVNKIQSRVSLADKETAAFIDESRTFEPIVANFAQKILGGQDGGGDASQLLVGNLIRQSQLLDDAQAHLSHDKETQALVGLYKDQLLMVRLVIPKTTSVLTMSEFWADTSHLLVTRNKLVTALKS